MTIMAALIKIFLLRIDIPGACEFYLDDPTVDHDTYYQTHFVGKALEKTWKLPRHHLGEAHKPLRDFVAGDDQAPYVSARAVEVLTPIIGQDAEFVSIGAIRGIQYYVMNVVRLVNALDRAKSEIQFSSEDPERICNVWKFAFNERELQNVTAFKILEDVGWVFVTKRFVDCILRHQISGVTFEDPLNMGIAGVNHVVPGLPIR